VKDFGPGFDLVTTLAGVALGAYGVARERYREGE
jgi:hypothetical protein